MTDNVAILKGYTQEMTAECDICTLAVLVKPGTDLDGRVTVWDMDDQEFIRLNGWLWTFEPVENPEGWREVDGVKLPRITWAE